MHACATWCDPDGIARLNLSGRAVAARAPVWRRLATGAWVAAAVLLFGPAGADAPPAQGEAGDAAAAVVQGASLERKVKAAFLYKFLGYTEFPASAFGDVAAPVVIGVAGADDLAAELTRIVSGRTVQGRPIAVRVLRDGDAAPPVHLLFVGGSDSARMRALLKTALPGPMLLVSEAENGLQMGSVINFKIVDQRVRFDVSLEAAERNSVKLSSRLLTVASQVLKAAP